MKLCMLHPQAVSASHARNFPKGLEVILNHLQGLVLIELDVLGAKLRERHPKPQDGRSALRDACKKVET